MEGGCCYGTEFALFMAWRESPSHTGFPHNKQTRAEFPTFTSPNRLRLFFSI